MNLKSYLIPTIYKSINLEKYIIFNILQEQNSTFLEPFMFMKNFITLDNFAKDLLNVLIKLLPQLVELKEFKISQIGLKGYFLNKSNFIINKKYIVILN